MSLRYFVDYRYNGSPTLAEQILDEISARANYQLWADALLACHAVQDYLKSSGQLTTLQFVMLLFYFIFDQVHENVGRFIDILSILKKSFPSYST